MASIDDLIIKLDGLANIDVESILQKACLIVENDAKLKCPVDTGALRSSITSEVEGDVGMVGTNVEYAPYVEFGTGLFSSKGDGRTDVPWRYRTADGKWHTTSGQQPQPYLQPALQQNKTRIEKLFKDAIKEAVKK